MHPLCRRHLASTFGKIILTASAHPADPPGTLRWTLPTGRRYTSTPTQLTARLPLDLEDDPPPF